MSSLMTRPRMVSDRFDATSLGAVCCAAAGSTCASSASTNVARIVSRTMPSARSLYQVLPGGTAAIFLSLVGLRNQASGIRPQESGLRNQAPGIRPQESGPRNQAPGIRPQGWSRRTLASTALRLCSGHPERSRGVRPGARFLRPITTPATGTSAIRPSPPPTAPCATRCASTSSTARRAPSLRR